MVMAETQDLPEFLVPNPLPDQAAWTPPPAFLFLQFNCQRATLAVSSLVNHGGQKETNSLPLGFPSFQNNVFM